MIKQRLAAAAAASADSMTS